MPTATKPVSAVEKLRERIKAAQQAIKDTASSTEARFGASPQARRHQIEELELLLEALQRQLQEAEKAERQEQERVDLDVAWAGLRPAAQKAVEDFQAAVDGALEAVERLNQMDRRCRVEAHRPLLSEGVTTRNALLVTLSPTSKGVHIVRRRHGA